MISNKRFLSLPDGQRICSLDDSFGISENLVYSLQVDVWVAVDNKIIYLPLQITSDDNSLVIKASLVNPATGGDSSIEMEYGFDLLSLGSVVYGTECKNYPPINDSPRAGKFDGWKLFGCILAAVVVVAVIAAVAPAVMPVALAKAGAIMAGALILARAIGDLLGGNISDEGTYMFDATVGFVSGAGGSALGSLGTKWSLTWFNKISSSLPKFLTPQILSNWFGAATEGASGALIYDMGVNFIAAPLGLMESKPPSEISKDMLISAALNLVMSRRASKFNDLTQEKDKILQQTTDAIYGTRRGPRARIRAFEELTGMNIIGKPAELRRIYGAATNAELAKMIGENPQLAIDALGVLAPNANLKVLQKTYADLAGLSVLPTDIAINIDSFTGNVTASLVSGTSDDSHFLTIGDTDIMMREIGNYLLRSLSEDEILEILDSSEIK